MEHYLSTTTFRVIDPFENNSGISAYGYDPKLRGWVKNAYVFRGVDPFIQETIMSYFISPKEDAIISLQKSQYLDIIERGRFFFSEFINELTNRFTHDAIVKNFLLNSDEIFEVICKIENPLMLIENNSYSIFIGRPYKCELELVTRKIKKKLTNYYTYFN
jgi:hypothetical protein